MTETEFLLRESLDVGLTPDTRLDRDRGIVYGVQLLGKKSLNPREYSEQAIREAFSEVEKAPSYIDHPPGESNDRSITERFGRFVGPYYDADGTLCAREYHYNPRHDFAPDFEWLVLNARESVGFSINAKATGHIRGDGIAVVTGWKKIYSFDVVDRPATTRGVFASVRESVQERRKSAAEPLPRGTMLTLPPGNQVTFPTREAVAMFEAAFTSGMQELTEQIKAGSVDKGGAIKALKTLLGLLGEKEPAPAADPMGGADGAAMDAAMSDAPDDDTKDIKAQEQLKALPVGKRAAVVHLITRLDAFKVREAVRLETERKTKLEADRVAKAKAKLPETAITAVFREHLVSAADDAAADRLIEDRLAILPKPAAGGQAGTKTADGKPFDVKESTKSIFSSPPTNTGGQDMTPEALKAAKAKLFG